MASKEGFEEVPVRVSAEAGVSTSPIVNCMLTGVSSPVARFGMSEMVGWSFAALTVTVNIREV